MTHSTGWGKAITFSWEYESSSPKIHEYYHPQLVDEALWDTLDFNTQKSVDRFLRGGPRPPGLDLGPEVARWLNEGNNRKVQDYETWVKSRRALEHWPDHLHQEGTGAKWEIAHRTYETDLDVALEQVDEMLQLFSPGAGPGGVRAKPNVHVHIAFKRPKKTLHQMQVLGLFILCNNLSFLKNNMSATGLLSRHNGVVTSSVAKDILAALKGNYDRLKEAKDGSSHAKFNRVGFRVQPYDHRVRRARKLFIGKSVRHLVGFEIRGGFDIDEYKALVRKITDILENIGKRNPSQDWNIDRIQALASKSVQGTEIQVGRQHIPVTVKPFMEKVAVAMARYSTRQNVPYGVEPRSFPVPAESPAVAAMKEKRFKQSAGRILDRWSVGFTPWEEFPLVPPAHSAELQAARQALETAIIRTAMGVTANGGISSENWRVVSGKVGRCLERWAATANVKEYFDIDAAIDNNYVVPPPQVVPAAAAVLAPAGMIPPPPPPPAPPFG